MAGGTVALDVKCLLRPDAFPHPVSHLEILETHISWVILTGQFAYKIKKPVDLGFLDFSSLELRKHFCEEEIRLNRRWAPEIYLGVVEIRGSEMIATVGGNDPIIDYAVKMVQFPQSAQLDKQLADGKLTDADMCFFAQRLATAHSSADVKTPDIAESIEKPMLDNFDEIAKHHNSRALQRLKDWTHHALQQLQSTLEYRRENGFIRECHGDLHLSNLVRLDTGITAFDCVEFSANLRDIDVISDVAFLVMDLVANQRSDLAFAFLNRYLELSGDYAGLKLLDLYFVYHCLIRAKVAAIRATNRTSSLNVDIDIEELLKELEAAQNFISRPSAQVIAMHGVSGSGKTWMSDRLMRLLPAIRIRSDIERKRIFGYEETEDSNSSVGQGLYTRVASHTVYSRLASLTTAVVSSDFTIIVDASFLHAPDRERFALLAHRLGARFLMVDTYAAYPVLIKRLQTRHDCESDASEADISVLQCQLATAEPLTAEEKIESISIDTDAVVDLKNTLHLILKTLPTPDSSARLEHRS